MYECIYTYIYMDKYIHIYTFIFIYIQLDRRQGLKSLAKMIYTNTPIWGEKKQKKFNEYLNKIRTLVIYENSGKNNESLKDENEKIKSENNKIEGELYMGDITTSNNDGFFHIAYDDGNICMLIYVCMYICICIYI
jgi:hypothetical protein